MEGILWRKWNEVIKEEERCEIFLIVRSITSFDWSEKEKNGENCSMCECECQAFKNRIPEENSDLI